MLSFRLRQCLLELIEMHFFCCTYRSVCVSNPHIFTCLGKEFDSSVGKESACNAGDPGLMPGLGRSAGEGIGYLLRYSCVSYMAQLVKNLPTVRETWCSIPGLGRSQIPLEQGKATHSSILAWRIP